MSFARLTDIATSLWARARRPLGVASALGWSVLLSGIAALSIGVAFGWAEFLGVASVVLLTVVAAIPFVLTNPHYAARVELASERVVVGEQAVGRVLVQNTAARTSPSARIELPVGRAQAEFRVPRLAPGEEHDDLFSIPTQRRAVLTLGPITSVRTDPLGLLRRTVDWTDPVELFVHPRVVPLSSETIGIIRDLEGLPTRDLADDDVSFHALREYVAGDDLRHVHWRSTARTGTLMIRQFEQTRRSHLVLVLSTRLSDYADENEFELAISIAGSIGLSALRGGKALSILTSSGQLICPTATALLDGLSAIEGESGARARGISDIAQEVTAHAPQASVVAFITGSGSAPVELRTGSLRVPATVRTMGVRAHTAGDLARRAVGDFAYIEVPELASLRRGMLAVTA